MTAIVGLSILITNNVEPATYNLQHITYDLL
jgi:hypothetical protein